MSKLNSQINMRLVYDNARALMRESGVNADEAVLTQGDLRLEQQLNTTRTNYQFSVLDNNNGSSGTFFNTEIRLTQQDAFVASAWGFYISKPSSATDSTYILHTYPNPVTFSTANVSAQAETLYNSIISIMVNNKNILPKMSMRRFRMVPQTQATTAAANVNGNAYDQIDLSSDGMAVAEPNLVLIGSKGTIITLLLPNNLTAVETFMRMHLIFEGVLAQNVTIIT